MGQSRRRGVPVWRDSTKLLSERDAEARDPAPGEIPPEPEVNTTLYRLFDDEGQLLYIGITNDLDARFKGHLWRKRKEWWWQVAAARFEHFHNRDEALEAEAAAIKAERPPWNVKHVPTERKPKEPKAKGSVSVDAMARRLARKGQLPPIR